MSAPEASPKLLDAMVTLVCDYPLLTERFYRRHFGFRRARVYLPGPHQVVVLKAENAYLQIFPAFEMRPPCLDAPSEAATPYPGGRGAGPLFTGLRKLTFLVSDVEETLRELGGEAKITQSQRPGLIAGSKCVWIADPSGNVIELISGYCDEASPPGFPENFYPETPLWRREPEVGKAVLAARKNDVAALEYWLKTGGNPDQYDSAGWSPLLAAAVRGGGKAVKLLLENDWRRADPEMPFLATGALPIHFAGQSGDVESAAAILAQRPEHLERIWDLNGHTLLLQAVFFGHLALAEFALAKGANTAATTVRGLASMELAAQFQNEKLCALIRPHDSNAAAKGDYYRMLLERIAPYIPAAEKEKQQLSDDLCASIVSSIQAGRVLAEFDEILQNPLLDVNRLGGALQQPPLVVAVTGASPDGEHAAARLEVVRKLLHRGADPACPEKHPMGVNAVIRAAVFNHLQILRELAGKLGAEKFSFAINEQPLVNGLTALHDSVLRASTASAEKLAGYLEQITWFTEMGARSDIADFSGRTQLDLARAVADADARQKILQALTLPGKE